MLRICAAVARNICLCELRVSGPGVEAGPGVARLEGRHARHVPRGARGRRPLHICFSLRGAAAGGGRDGDELELHGGPH